MTLTEKQEQQERVPLGNALIVVDVQNDFCPGGSLAVDGGDVIARRIHEYVDTVGDSYKLVLATKDYHPDAKWESAYGKFIHFSDTPDYVDTWPPHCVQGTEGVNFHPALNATARNDLPWPPEPGMIEFDLVFYKGQFDPAYSGFEGTSYPSGGPNRNADAFGWKLHQYLQDKQIGHVDIVGLATDYCVKATALDAVKHGYDVTVLTSMVAGVAEASTKAALDEVRDAGIHFEDIPHPGEDS